MMATLSEFCDEPKRFVTIARGCYGPKRTAAVKAQTSEQPCRRAAALRGREGSRAIAFSILAANANVQIGVRRLPHVTRHPGQVEAFCHGPRDRVAERQGAA